MNTADTIGSMYLDQQHGPFAPRQPGQSIYLLCRTSIHAASFEPCRSSTHAISEDARGNDPLLPSQELL